MSKLTNEQLSQLAKVLKVNECPNCKSTKHKISDSEIFHMLALDQKAANQVGIKLPFSYIPLIACTCPDCGYTYFFNLKTLGILTD